MVLVLELELVKDGSLGAMPPNPLELKWLIEFEVREGSDDMESRFS